MNEREYKEEFDLLKTKGILSEETRRKHQEALKKHPYAITENLLEKGKETRFKKGEPNLGKYKRTEAESIRIQAQAITQQGGKDYVQLQAIAKWNGQLPQQFVPNSAVLFINLK